MKKIGIVGGVGWRSTAHYYARICASREGVGERNGRRPPDPCELSIESLDLAKAVSLLGRDGEPGSWEAFDLYHRAALERVAAAGAEVALIASNTPHERFEAITEGLAIPVVDLFTVLAETANGLGAANVLVLGTAVTMRSRRLRRVFGQYGLVPFAPPPESETELLLLIRDLQRGPIPDGPARLERIVASAHSALPERLDAVCLACTELPLALEDDTGSAILFRGGLAHIDSVEAHVAATIARAGG